MEKIKKIMDNKDILGIILVTPIVLLIIFINIYPILLAIYNSFFDIRGLANRGFVGLQNYIDIFTNPRFWRSLLVTIYFAIGSISIQMVFGMLIALALNKSFKGRKFVRAIIIIPWAIPSSLGAMMWNRFFAPYDGFINATLRYIGLLEGSIYWFSSSVLALIVIIFVDTWRMTPYYAILLLAGLQAIPKSYYEAAAVNGASKLKAFFYITLPQLKPIVLIILILRTVHIFFAFDLIYILTAGGPGDSTRVLAYYAYQEAFQNLHHGRGAVMSFFLFVVVIILSFFYIKFFKYGSNIK